MPKGSLKAYRKAHRFRTRASSKSHEPSTSTTTSLPPPNSFLGLPTEIKQAIFSSLADVVTLKALILTCSCLYHAFLDVESLTVTNILRAQIDPSLMQDALTILQCSRITTYSKETALALQGDYSADEMTFSVPTWTLRDTLDLSEIYSHVEFFAKEFASSALSHNPVTGLPETDPITISPSELIRIQRTLYRFELHHNLFARRRKFFGGRTKRVTTNDRGACFFENYAPWKNEQLACVRDYLFEALSTGMAPFVSAFNDFGQLNDPALNDAAEQTVRRRVRKLLFGSEQNPARYLSLGLTFLHRIILAKTCNERYQLLCRQWLTNGDSFPAALDSPDAYGYTPHSWLTEQEQRDLIFPQVADDDDSGPKDALHWAHADCVPSYWYNTREREDLR